MAGHGALVGGCVGGWQVVCAGRAVGRFVEDPVGGVRRARQAAKRKVQQLIDDKVMTYGPPYVTVGG